MNHVYPKGFGNPPNLTTAREFIAACQQEQADLRQRIKAQVEKDGGLSLEVASLCMGVFSTADLENDLARLRAESGDVEVDL